MGAENQAKITVVVTVYNIADYLPRFFESMAAQTYPYYRILIVDDGSEDNSLEVCRTYATKDDRIVIHARPHAGISPARNYSMEQLDTEYTVHADGDDYVEPDYLLHLLTAIEKYNADWAISRVAYQSEGSDHIDSVFPAYGEKMVKREEFADFLPMLFSDRRLNYLYGKIYKTEYFKTLRIEPDVKQGSDTMINCQYIEKIANLVVIDDVDYHYIKYNARSVTSYAGAEAFERLKRINRFVIFSMKKQGLFTPKMEAAVDNRTLLSAIWVTERILNTVSDREAKQQQIDLVLNDEMYVEAYQRAKRIGFEPNFHPIPPQSGKNYLRKVDREENNLIRKAAILKKCPKFLVKLYRKIRGKHGEE